MKTDTSKPWEDTTPKKPKLGEVLEAIIEIQNDSTSSNEELNNLLTEIEIDVDEQLSFSKSKILKELENHTSKKGPAHGETKNTIGLSKKENLPAASLEDIKNGEYKHEWLTPRTLNLIIEQTLKANTDEYMTSVSLPISTGRLLGRILTNQAYRNEDSPLLEIMPSGQVSYLFSTEENYIMFAEFGQGRITDFSEGGSRAPIGVTSIDIREGNIYTNKYQPISLNNITTSGNFVKKVTGLEWGFGEDRGNYYDSNFYPTFVVESEEEGTNIQEVEVSLFDPTMIYKSDGTIYIRNLNTTKHNFNELYINQDGKYPFNNSVYLSSDNFMTHIANTQLIQQNNVWGIMFDFMSGDVGIPDWYPDEINTKTDKILSKRGYYNLKHTFISSIIGYENSKAIIKSSGDVPWGMENRENFNYSNFVNGAPYTSVFIPINSIINGFDNLSEDHQQKVINGIDRDLLIRISMAWDNEYTKNGVLRIPFYYVVPDTDISWSTYIDLRFIFDVKDDNNGITISAFNFDNSKRPNIGEDLNLIRTSDSDRFYQWSTDIKENPFHPKVFKGCFLETGGHITAYVIGHRQYICYYKHDITSVKNWILNDLIPVLNEEKNRIEDVSLFPCNRFYGDNTRLVPLIFDSITNKITYLSRMRNKHNQYDYGTFTVDMNTFDVLVTRETQSSEITWLDKRVNKNIPILVDNSNLQSPGVNTTALVFSETNGFIGYQDHGFDGYKFNPAGVTEIESSLKFRISLISAIEDPYTIYFYKDQVLYWSIASRSGKKNKNGFDVCIGGVRVDTLYDGKSYTIRSLPGMELKPMYGVLFEDYPEGILRGRESESFDDVYIINKTGDDETSTVFVNYPDLEGRYYSFEIKEDNAGYKFPSIFNPTVLNLKKESGYGEYCPYVFFGSNLAPFMLTNKLYLPSNDDIFKLISYESNGVYDKQSYYMGWKNEQPLYVTGEHVTVNGQSLLLSSGINIPIDDDSYTGKVFVTYYNDEFKVHTTNKNPFGYPIDPNNAVMFAGYWEKINDFYVLNFHAPRGLENIESQDFINSLLPVIDNKQMATDSMGGTFPATLGILSEYPRQYYFRKQKSSYLVRVGMPENIKSTSISLTVFVYFTGGVEDGVVSDMVITGPTPGGFKFIESEWLGDGSVRFSFFKPTFTIVSSGIYYFSFTYDGKTYKDIPLAILISSPEVIG